MRVVELTAYQVRIPLRRVIRHATFVRTATDNIVVRCRLSDGVLGWGEGVPREYVTGETIETALAALRDAGLPSQLPPWSDLPEAVQLAERITLPALPGDTRGIRNHAARCAVELALLDAATQSAGVPLSAVTPLVAPDLAVHRDRVQYSGAIASADGWRLRAIAWAYRLYGFAQVKVKVGIDGQDDVARLRAIRRRLGPRVQIRVDANEAWSARDAADRIQSLEPFRLSSIEQPIPHEQVAALSEIRRNVSTAIMLDESLCGTIDAEHAIRNRLCDAFNLRLSKCGGFIPTLRLAQLARRNGITYQLGCQVGETAILSAAGRHWAASVDGWTAIEGSFDRHLVGASLADRDITFGRGGWAPALDRPGLGISVQADAVDRLTVRSESLLG